MIEGKTVRAVAAALLCTLIAASGVPAADAAESAFRIGRIEYRGGGDWYVGPSAEPNLLNYIREHTNIRVESAYEPVSIMSDRLFSYTMLFMTGHGNISFNEQEIGRLREYLRRGGFLYADDCYGMDAAFRREMRKLFPDQELVELYSISFRTVPRKFMSTTTNRRRDSGCSSTAGSRCIIPMKPIRTTGGWTNAFITIPGRCANRRSGSERI
jgi:hypothetical protein